MDTNVVKSYIDAGFWVVPLKGKIPIGSAKGWQKSPLPEETILSSYPRIADNVGLVCNRTTNMICIDIDCKPETGRDGYNWFKKHEDDFDGCFIQRTGSGGYHILFKYPKDSGLEIHNSKDKLAKGVEVLADGRYFVAAPSIHPETKKPYEVEHGLTMLDFAHEATELPSWLIKEIQDNQTVFSKPTNIPMDIGYANDEDLRLARMALNFIRPTQGDLGDQKTFTACCIGIDYNVEKSVWWETIKSWNNTNCTPPWSEKDLLIKFNNAYKYIKTPPGARTAEGVFAEDLPESIVQSSTGDEIVGRSPENKGNIRVLETPLDFKKPNETGSQLLRQAFFGRLVYLEEDFYYYFLDTNCWELIGRDKLESLIRTEVRRRDANANIKSADVTEIIKAMTSQLKAADVDRNLALDTRLDGHTGDFIRLQNGIVNLFKEPEDRSLEPHTPMWFSTTILPFSYDPLATCPNWHSFLESVFEDDESSIECLRYWMAYCISNTYRFQKAMLMVGRSRAGKGVISRVLESLVGAQNTSGCSLTGLADGFGLQPLIGKKICFLHDAHKGQGATADIALERLKSIIGRDSLQINRKNKSMSNIRLNCKVTMVTNQVPNFVDSQNAFLSRMLLLRFKKSFVGQEDAYLEDRLFGELAGIFNWVAEVVPSLHEIRALPSPEDQEDYKKTLERSLNPIAAFISDELELDIMSHITRDDMSERYVTWCNDNGRIPLSRDKLIQVLKDNLEGKEVKYTRRRIKSGLFNSEDNRAYLFQGLKFKDLEADEDLL